MRCEDPSTAVLQVTSPTDRRKRLELRAKRETAGASTLDQGGARRNTTEHPRQDRHHRTTTEAPSPPAPIPRRATSTRSHRPARTPRANVSSRRRVLPLGRQEQLRPALVDQDAQLLASLRDQPAAALPVRGNVADQRQGILRHPPGRFQREGD